VTASFKRAIVLILALLLGVAIVVVSVMPLNRVALGTRSPYAASPSVAHHAAFVHAIAHIVIFAIVACGAWFVADYVDKGLISRMLAAVFAMLLGCTTEYFQHAVYHHAIELNDVFTNVVSSGVAFMLLALVDRLRTKRPDTVNEAAFILRDLD
jgi:hypothetical protein